MMRSRSKLAIAAAAAVYVFWGFTFLASAVAQKWGTPFVLLAYRFDLASLLMAVPLLIGKEKINLRGKNIKGLLLLGLMEPCLYFIGEQYGVRYTNSAFSGVIIAVIPIVTLILSAVVLKDRPSLAQWLFSLLSIAGVIIITLSEEGDGAVSLLGVICLIGAVITGSACTVISRRTSDSFSVYERTLVMQLMGAVFFTVLAVMENIENPAALIAPLAHRDFILAVLYLSVFASVLGYTLFNYAIAYAPVAKVVILVNLTTVISVIAGVLILGDHFSLISAAAMLAVLFGIWGVQRY